MYVTGMVTKIYQSRPRRLFIQEWQDKWDISPETMASRLGIARESYYRILRETHRINTERLEQLAEAMGHHMTPQDFYRPPERPSIDALLENADDDTRETVFDLARRLTNKKAS